ncbi:MAG: ABC transporter substrate-binding protein [Actinobacteria bacterium]|nr:ABC transporter substrate-binding protein [Actinomycetota bacterium]
MKEFRSWRVPALLLAAVLALGACGGGPEPASGALAFTDALGRTVEFDELPQRLVVTGRGSPMVVDALYLFPVGRERLVALDARTQDVAPFLQLLDPDWEAKARLDRDAGAEQIAPTAPDLVIAKSSMAETLGGPLEAVGIAAFYVDFETPEHYRRDLTALGELLGDPQRAEQVVAYYQDRLDRISSATAGLDEGQRPSVLVLQHSEEGGSIAFKVAPAVWLQTTMVELAGGDPVWVAEAGAGGWTVVGFEQIAAWNPDQIFVISYARDAEEVVEDLRGDTRWRALAAVSSGSIYAFPGDFVSWDQPDPRWILGLTWLFTKVQPGLAGGIDIRAEVAGFFGEMYGMDPGLIEAEVVPRLYGSLP